MQRGRRRPRGPGIHLEQRTVDGVYCSILQNGDGEVIDVGLDVDRLAADQRRDSLAKLYNIEKEADSAEWKKPVGE